MVIQDGQSIIAVASGRFSHYPLKWWDEGFGPLWIYSETMGPVGVVRALSFEEAWECVLDEILLPIDVADVAEAYEYGGCEADSNCDARVTHRGFCAAHPESYRQLGEGYHYMPNFGGASGIVQTDLNGSELREVRYEDFDDIGLRILLETN